MREQRGRLIFIDEAGTTTKMTRLRGRSMRGKRLNGKAPFGHWGTQTFVAGLKCDGLIAPWVIDAPMNRAIFEVYVETQLAPTLKPGDVVILDNLSSHKSQRAETAVRARGAWLLFRSLRSPLQPGPQSNRDGLRKAQSPPPCRRRQNHRRPLESHRQHLRLLQTPRIFKQLRRSRIRIQLTARSSRLLQL